MSGPRQDPTKLEQSRAQRTGRPLDALIAEYVTLAGTDQCTTTVVETLRTMDEVQARVTLTRAIARLKERAT